MFYKTRLDAFGSASRCIFLPLYPYVYMHAYARVIILRCTKALPLKAQEKTCRRTHLQISELA